LAEWMSECRRTSNAVDGESSHTLACVAASPWSSKTNFQKVSRHAPVKEPLHGSTDDEFMLAFHQTISLNSALPRVPP